jgi:flagellin-like hook-associated protein FlgL
MGADGRGRLVIPAAAAGVVNIAEDAAGSPFGFKLLGANSTLTGTTVTGPAGSPAAMDVTFSATLPQDGESIRVSLLLPDGTETDITLTARATATGQPGDFVIGADENDTADNFQAALTAAVENEAQVSLRAASLFAAADNFFDFDETMPPQRVDGPPFDSATALRDATATDTVFWYQGELSSLPARESAIVKADDSSFVSYGARADEDGFATFLKQLAVISVETFEGDQQTASQRYTEVKGRMVDSLNFTNGAQSPDSILTELTTAKGALGRISERHQASETLLTDFVYDTENADINEVSAQILTLQARLEASLQVTAILKQISLVNFL